MSIRQPTLVFLMILGITLLIYWQGVHGIFFMDDLGVLPSLGGYSQLGHWRDFLLYLLEGNTGPTGRPISLASFYLNSQSWPASPYYFKVTNIFIHLLNATLILLLLKKLGRMTVLSAQKSIWFSVLATSLWLLHPYQITSVLYVVQRMTELSTLFMLIGLLIYLYGREILVIKPSFKHYTQLTIGIISVSLLAIFSKENGLLMFGYILVLEYFFLRPLNEKIPQHFHLWLTVIVTVPFVLALTYVLSDGLRATAYLARPFTLEERLLTEARVILDYLANILLPGFATPSLFHDDYVLSKDWLHPWTTLPAVATIMALTAIGIFYRKKYPIIGFAVFWFFCGHLLESTVVPLEIYFEHRNYLSLLGPMVAIAYLCMILLENFPDKQKAVIVTLILYATMMISMLTLNANSWGKPVQMIVGWAQEHPNSARSVEMLTVLETDFGYKIQNKNLTSIITNMQEKQNVNLSYTLFRELAYSCLDGKLNKDVLALANKRINNLQFANSATLALDAFINNWVDNKCPIVKADEMIGFLDALSAEKSLQKGDIPHYIEYSLARIWMHERDLNQTLMHLDKAYQLKPELGGLLMKANILSSAKLYNEALTTLQDTHFLERTWRERMMLTLRQPEIDQAKKQILEQKQQYEVNTNDNTQHHIASQK